MLEHVTAQLFPRPFAHLPTLHETETLYSWFGRIRVLNGRPQATQLCLRLFGTPSSALAHDIPTDLEQFTAQFEDVPNAQHLALRHSVVGYYLPWLSPERVDLVMNYARFGGIANVRMRLGLPATRLGKHPLKACRSCLYNEQANRGYALWHVRNQYPSVWACEEHQEVLSAFLPNQTFRHQRRWFTPHRIRSGDFKEISVGEPTFEAISRMSHFSIKASEQTGSTFWPDQLASTYREALAEQGFLTAGGSLRMRRLLLLVAHTYSPLKAIPEFCVVDTLSEDWAGFVGDVARLAPKPVHPMKHLLLINVLFESWEQFLTAYASEKDDEFVAPAENCAPRDSRQYAFVDLVVRHGLSITAAGQRMGVTATTAVRWAKLHGLKYTRRTKRITEEILERCRVQLRKGTAKKQVANANSVSVVTITRLLSSEPRLHQEWQSAISSARRELYRCDFQALLGDNPGVPLRLLRKLPNNHYMWLYRHDADWLAETLARNQW